MYKLLYYPEVEEDLFRLDDAVLQEVFEYFEKYKEDPFSCSAKLFNQGEIQLKGYRKTYVAGATIRIVIYVANGVAKIVEVVAVGARDKKEVYKMAQERVQKVESEK